jgi:hypothetical protein
LRAIEWLKDAVDDYRHWEKMQDKAQQQEQHQQNESRQPGHHEHLLDHHPQNDSSPTLCATSMSYPLTPRKMMALKSGTSLESPSSSVVQGPHAPPHSPSRITDFEVSLRAFTLNFDITVLKVSIT